MIQERPKSKDAVVSARDKARDKSLEPKTVHSSTTNKDNKKYMDEEKQKQASTRPSEDKDEIENQSKARSVSSKTDKDDKLRDGSKGSSKIKGKKNNSKKQGNKSKPKNAKEQTNLLEELQPAFKASILAELDLSPPNNRKTTLKDNSSPKQMPEDTAMKMVFGCKHPPSEDCPKCEIRNKYNKPVPLSSTRILLQR